MSVRPGAEPLLLTVGPDAEVADDPRIGAVELRDPIDFDGEMYVELPLDGSLDERLDELALRGLRAKVRCGGTSVPDAGDLARVIRGCRVRAVVFKAHAGLPHAYPTETVAARVPNMAAPPAFAAGGPARA